MDTATVKLVATKEEPGVRTLPNLKPGVIKKRQWREDLLLIKNNEETLCIQQSRPPGKSKSCKKNGHTIYTCLQPQFTIRKQSSRSSGRSADENMTTQWTIRTWMWLFGAYFRIPLFRQQFILDKTMGRIYDSWKIIFGIVWDSYSVKMKNWSVNQQRSLV